jgi:hypothetical protein
VVKSANRSGIWHTELNWFGGKKSAIRDAAGGFLVRDGGGP